MKAKGRHAEACVARRPLNPARTEPVLDLAVISGVWGQVPSGVQGQSPWPSS